ncbi:CocE/NonD family hydrolase [Mycolicibacterium elephantis]|uniref:CocE/NonD family hydrolase n=1 Tax=Mycolicibacterium elephantis TaxID=81858 RepID=UPI001F2A5721|nr:CocE/NonD family hydrolase [Mycolicibacterium elephantis]
MSQAHLPAASVIQDGMRIDWDVPIEMDDGIVLRADVFRPIDDDPAPVLLTYGPYGKGMRFSDHHPEQWQQLIEKRPEVLSGSTNKYQAWETPDPERWVPHGYACVRVDSRGSGRSPGFLDPQSIREFRDAALCIEWAGKQPWSNGRVGMLGISYYAGLSWRVAALEPQPSHLAAICAWEGNADLYRDAFRHGGILTTWAQNWWKFRILTVQHGLGERGAKNPNNGEFVSGPDTLTDAELRANRVEWAPERQSERFTAGDWWRFGHTRWENVRIPILSAGNWGGAALHLRGNTEAMMRAATEEKWLEIHGQEHWTEFYSDYGLDLQRRFFDRFLKGERSRWHDEPRVILNIRHPGERYVLRGESDWPIPDTQWVRMYLDAGTQRLVDAPPRSAAEWSFDARGDGIRFWSDPLAGEREITGPIAVRLHISSTTTDADLFVVVHVFDPSGEEVTFQGAMDPYSSVGKGWLRASHRKLDPVLTREYRPYHTHDEPQPLVPGEVYELDVEVWPTSIVIPAGHRIGLSVLGRDYLHLVADPAVSYESFGEQARRFGSGAMLHDDPRDRPSETFHGTTTVHSGPRWQSFLLLPVIPPRGHRDNAAGHDVKSVHPQERRSEDDHH